MVSKQTGTIITGVMAVLFGCAALFTCIGGVTSAGAILRNLRFGGGTLFGSGLYVGLGSTLCTSLGFIALPVVFYIILVANNKETPAPAAQAAPPEPAEPPKPQAPA